MDTTESNGLKMSQNRCTCLRVYQEKINMRVTCLSTYTEQQSGLVFPVGVWMCVCVCERERECVCVCDYDWIWRYNFTLLSQTLVKKPFRAQVEFPQHFLTLLSFSLPLWLPPSFLHLCLIISVFSSYRLLSLSVLWPSPLIMHGYCTAQSCTC